MSQAKVDRYKQEKYNRKNNKKKGSAKKILSYAIVTLVGVAFVVYIGYCNSSCHRYVYTTCCYNSR